MMPQRWWLTPAAYCTKLSMVGKPMEERAVPDVRQQTQLLFYVIIVIASQSD
jgi:hypothetical protein